MQLENINILLMRKKYLPLLLLSFCFCAEKLEANNLLSDKDSIVMSYTAKEVVVESFKRNDDLSLQPLSASFLSDKTIRDLNITNISEVTGFVPNLFVPDYGSKMTSPAYIRGIGSRINAPSVGLYIDGVPYFDRSTFDFSINDIERIEVLRGPQGTLYGRNTMGGIINVYTKSPFRYKGTNVGLSAGNYNNYLIEASHYGNVNNKFGYSYAGNLMHGGGYFKNIYTGKKADRIDATSHRVRLSWLINSQLSAHLTSAYEYSDQDGYPYRLFNVETREMEDVNYNERSYFRRNMFSNGLHIEYVTSHFKLGSQTSFQYFDGKQGLDQDFSPRDLFFVDFYQRQHMYSQEFNIKSVGNGKYKWQFGLFGFHQNYYNNNNVETRTAVPPQNSIQKVHSPATGLAAYHQSIIDDLFTKGLSLILGVRYDWEENKLRAQKTVYKHIIAPEVSPEVKDRSDFSQVSPKAAVQYTFANQEMIYASVAKGFKTGGFNTTAELEEERTFKPEHSWNYEIGTKGTYLNGLLNMDFSLFYIRWNNQQVSQPKSTGQGYVLRNAGKSVSKGVEVTANVNPVKNLNLQLNYGYTHATFKEYFDSRLNKSYNGNSLPMVPRNTFSAAANYKIGLRQGWIDNIVLHAQYTGIGKIYWDEDNLVKQPFYGVVDGQVSFNKKQFTFGLWGKNLGQTEYIAYYFKLKELNKDYVQKGRPLTFGVNMFLKF